MLPAEYPGEAAVLLLRHAATRWNVEQRRLGWADHPLTPAGRRAAGEWAELAQPRPEVVFCSDLMRARQTALLIAQALDLGGVEELSGLREQDQGAWTGLTKQQIKLRWPELARQRPVRPVGGEEPEAVVGRVLRALRAIAAAHPGRRVLAVTHSQVIRLLEQAIAVPAPAVPHLQGRWLTVSATAGLGARGTVRGLRVGALTPGRLGAPVAAAEKV